MSRDAVITFALVSVGVALGGAPGCSCESEPRFRPSVPSVERTTSARSPTGDPRLPGVEFVDVALLARLDAATALEPASPRTDPAAPRFTNRLVLEASPYLRQHAHNPVNWFPWGDEAFERARSSGRPVLLSIGYSTCHWCHVMAAESFEDEEVARFINERFIPIKVDREERPDVDEIYMRSVQAMTGNGGWPMTLVLTPDRQPIFAATYLPPRAGVRGARSGLVEVLGDLARRYSEDRDVVLAEAAASTRRLIAESRPVPPAGVPGPELVSGAVATFARSFDSAHGGFGGAPKFPQPSRLLLLLEHHRAAGDPQTLAIVTRTLDAMIDGGIHDPIGGGFHRYATDAAWLVPHFEKMLYDNALLATVLVEAWLATRNARYAAFARETLDYVLREMRDGAGAFYSATDADSLLNGEEVEGAYFTWTSDEIRRAVGPDLETLAIALYGGGGVVEGRGVLRFARSARDAAQPEQVEQTRSLMLETRRERPPPARDEKIVVATTGLAISALARAGFALDPPDYIAAAERAHDFLWDHVRDADGSLLHEWILGEARLPGFLDDYASLLVASLDLFEASGERRFLERAVVLAAALDARFLDTETGAYFVSQQAHAAPLVRLVAYDDGAMPAGTSLAALGLIRLAALTDDASSADRAVALLRALMGPLTRAAVAMPHALLAVALHHARVREIAIVTSQGDPGDTLLAVVRSSRAPRALVITSTPESLADIVPWLRDRVAASGHATAYVCERGRCELPTADAEELRRQLDSPGPH